MNLLVWHLLLLLVPCLRSCRSMLFMCSGWKNPNQQKHEDLMSTAYMYMAKIWANNLTLLITGMNIIAVITFEHTVNIWLFIKACKQCESRYNMLKNESAVSFASQTTDNCNSYSDSPLKARPLYYYKIQVFTCYCQMKP